jgi:hypothetical protein
MAGIGFQIGAVHIGFQLKAAGRHAHRLGKFGFELFRHANQRAIAGGDKALAAPQRFAMPIDKARSAGDNLRDRRRQPLEFGKIVLLLGFAGLPWLRAIISAISSKLSTVALKPRVTNPTLSIPVLISRTPSQARPVGLCGSEVRANTGSPEACTLRIASSVDALFPLCEIATTRSVCGSIAS